MRILIRKEKKSKNILRLQSLIHIKEKSFARQVDLALHLGYSVRSMAFWLKLYKEGGLESMLIGYKKQQQRKRLVSLEVHQGLSSRLTNPEERFNSYVQALEWVEQTYGANYAYSTLRQYMIDFFGTKIKITRKTHVKKYPEAQANFLKLT